MTNLTLDIGVGEMTYDTDNMSLSNDKSVKVLDSIKSDERIGAITDHSKHIKNVDEFNKGWNKENIPVVNYWMNYLSYCCLIYHFYLFKLKKKENYWAWLIIVLSALASSLSLFQYNQDDYYVDLIVKLFLTAFTLCITLISAWMKKQNYVEHISELSKYSLKINKLKGNVNSVMREPISSRITYKEFIDKYKDDIINYISVRPLISPRDWKETIYIISRYYPELAAYEYPWNKIPDYGLNAMNTYKNIKYQGLWNKIRYCYFFKSRCMWNGSENKKYDAANILTTNIKFYKKLPKTDFDSEHFNCFLYQYDSDIVETMKDNNIYDNTNVAPETSTVTDILERNHRRITFV